MPACSPRANFVHTAFLQIPQGVSLEAMRCALRGHITGRAANANCFEVFDEFDADNSGDLDREELALVSATLGNLLGSEGLDDLFEELDEDGDGTVSRDEFAIWWERDVAPNQAINARQQKLSEVTEEARQWGDLSTEEIFHKIDADGSGTLDREEVARLAAALGCVLTERQHEEMFSEMDKDGNGEVDAAEFTAWWDTNYAEYLGSVAAPRTGD